MTDLVHHCGHETLGMVDDFNQGQGIIGNFEFAIERYPPSEAGFAIAVGYSNIFARWSIWEKIRGKGYHAPSLIHPRAYVAENALVGPGAMVMAGAIVDVRVKIGDLAVVWPGACISHDCVVGRNSFISPNATLCGYVNLGDHCFVGAGAAIVDHCSVPAATRIKMLTRHTGEIV